MNKFVNEAIKIDLHIHSKASTHKEDVNIIDDSKIENKISLCVITDHNRFDYDPYKILTPKAVS